MLIVPAVTHSGHTGGCVPRPTGHADKAMSIEAEVSGQNPHPEHAPDEAEKAAVQMTGQVERAATPVPHNAAAARDMVTRLLSSRFCGMQGEGLADVVVADALLVTSELVTNAFRHGGGLTEFTADITDEGLLVVVGDTSTRAPLVHASEAAGVPRLGGYGWPLVRRLTKNVTITLHSTGKHITALVPLA
ncbi:ATP-binding protein [Streptomyces sp. NPDC058685]|uniref:ATP-binding protein n=1 Tax=Streptomyces sp. NPDC058685 TaxID=3346598 RepID=UPI003648B602